MFAFAGIGVRVPVGASGELLVGQFAEAAPVCDQRLTLDVRVGVLLTETAAVLTHPPTLLLKHLRTDLPLAESGDLVGARQEPAQRRWAQEDSQPVVPPPLAVRVSDGLSDPPVALTGAGVGGKVLELDAEGRIRIVPACWIAGSQHCVYARLFAGPVAAWQLLLYVEPLVHLAEDERRESLLIGERSGSRQ